MTALLGYNIWIPEYRILSTVRYLVSKHHANVQISNSHGISPLRRSFEYGLNFVTRYLWHCDKLKKISSNLPLQNIESESESFSHLSFDAEVQNIPGNTTPRSNESEDEKIVEEKILEII